MGNSSLFLPPCPASPAKHQTLSWHSRLPQDLRAGSLPLTAGTRWWGTALSSSLPALPPLQNTKLCPGRAGSVFGLVWSQEHFSFQPSHCPWCPWFLDLDSVYPWWPHHPTLVLGSAGVAGTSSHDLAGAPLNFVCGHGHLIFI